MGLGFKNPTKEDSYLKSATPRKIQSGAKSKRGGIPVRVDICERLAIADQKTEIDYWESDTMIGGNHLGVLVTYIDLPFAVKSENDGRIRVSGSSQLSIS